MRWVDQLSLNGNMIFDTRICFSSWLRNGPNSHAISLISTFIQKGTQLFSNIKKLYNFVISVFPLLICSLFGDLDTTWLTRQPRVIIQDERLHQLRQLLETSHRGVGALYGNHAASVLVGMASHGTDQLGTGSYHHLYDTVLSNRCGLHPHQIGIKPWMLWVGTW